MEKKTRRKKMKINWSQDVVTWEKCFKKSFNQRRKKKKKSSEAIPWYFRCYLLSRSYRVRSQFLTKFIISVMPQWIHCFLGKYIISDSPNCLLCYIRHDLHKYMAKYMNLISFLCVALIQKINLCNSCSYEFCSLEI